jgi:plastocyanin
MPRFIAHRLGFRRIRRRRVIGATAMLAAALTLPLLIHADRVEATSGANLSITGGGCAGGGTSYCYSPESATVSSGGSAVWTNQSGVMHTATLCTASACPGFPGNSGGNTFNVTIGATNGSTGSFTFTSPGTYYYYCTIHLYAAMHGVITVSAAAPPPAPGSSPSSASRAVSPGTPGSGASPGPFEFALVAALVGGGSAAVLLALGLRRRRMP